MISGQEISEGRGFDGELHKKQEYSLFNSISLAQHGTRGMHTQQWTGSSLRRPLLRQGQDNRES